MKSRYPFFDAHPVAMLLLREFLGMPIYFMLFAPAGFRFGCDNTILRYLMVFISNYVFSVALDASVCNPATAVGLWVIGRTPLSSLIYSIISQCLGAVIALPMLQLVMGSRFVDVYELGPSIPKGIGIPTAFTSEMMIGVYMLVHLAASGYADSSSRMIRAVTIAAESYTYVLIGAASCNYSGASHNPAYALAWGIWNGHLLSTGASIDGTYVVVYMLAPVLGCTLAAILWALVTTARDYAAPKPRQVKEKTS